MTNNIESNNDRAAEVLEQSLTKAMCEWRSYRDSDKPIPADLQAEVDHLVKLELEAAILNTEINFTLPSS